jgi:electron transfer flavoprotein alpha subunit
MFNLLFIAFEKEETSQGAGFAQALGIPFDMLVLSEEAPTHLGAKNIYLAPFDEIPPADNLTPALKEYAEKYTHIAAISSMHSKDVMARLGGYLQAAVITDVIAKETPLKFKRPIIAGSLIATVEAKTTPLVLTVRPAGFEPPKQYGESCVHKIQLNIQEKSRRISATSRKGGRPDLSQAKRIVSGGRPLKTTEDFEKLIGGLADLLGGAAGATRAAVDRGIAPNELQVGQTGKVVAPDLYIAAGISGSTQHMAGIKDSKFIVAINTDPDAPIFEFADLGIVADLYQVIPEMMSKIKKV